jgi:hypothetical protein
MASSSDKTSRREQLEGEMIMPKFFSSFAIALLAFIALQPCQAQVLSTRYDAILLPSNASSADSLKLTVAVGADALNCNTFKGNPYRVSMSQGNVTITLGDFTPAICPPLLPRPRLEIDLGRLPAGTYTLTMTAPAAEFTPAQTLIDKVPFTIIDARASKAAPFVPLDYSGHWWDPNDSGWGLFIWQDAKNPADTIFAAWFSYTPDGKPMWYVFQPKWETRFATAEAPLLQTSRPPGATSPPPGPTANSQVGTASLDFTNFGTADEGKLTYTISNGTKQVRTIQRFKP